MTAHTIKRLQKKWEAYKINRIIFLLTGFPPFLAGLDAISLGNYTFGILYMVTGSIFLASAYYARQLKPLHLDLLQLSGIIILLITIVDLYLQHKRYLPFVYGLAALVSIWAFWYGKKKANGTSSLPGSATGTTANK